MTIGRAFPVFSIAFALIYIALVWLSGLDLKYNYALITYHAETGRWGVLAEAQRQGPAMYWYGWLLTSALGAGVLAAASLALPARPFDRIWSILVWVAPLAMMATITYILRGYFLR